MVTVPANGALSVSSIFIASMTPSSSPSVDAPGPRATATARTVPGIGAVTVPSPTTAPRAGPERVGPLEDERVPEVADLHVVRR